LTASAVFVLLTSGMCIQCDTNGYGVIQLDTRMGYEYFTYGTAQTKCGVLHGRCKVGSVILPTCHR
jgi:hypothetical protein